MLCDQTGTGCMCSSLIGSFCGAASDDPFTAAITAMLCMGIAGEIAFKKAGELGNGSFRIALHDAINLMDDRTLEKKAKYNEK
jgi:hydroxyethylthiazole kinase